MTEPELDWDDDIYKMLESKDAEIERLRAAVTDLTSCGDEACRVVHHPNKDRHGVGEPCPVLARYRLLADPDKQEALGDG